MRTLGMIVGENLMNDLVAINDERTGEDFKKLKFEVHILNNLNKPLANINTIFKFFQSMNRIQMK